MTDESAAVVSARDIIRAAIDRNIVDGSWEVSGSDLDDAADGVLTALQQAGYAVVSHVWVPQLELGADAGYIGVHTTQDGAADALVRWANDNGIDIDQYDSSVGSELLDDHPDVSSYGLSYVEVSK